MKYRVCIYEETYRTIEVDADTEENAREIVLQGEYEDENVVDVTVKESDVIQVEKV